MDDEILKNIWNTLTNDGATKSDFETWKTNFSGSDEVQNNVHTYLTDKKYTKSDIETWRTNVGITTSEKKNQVVTPSDGVEEVTVSTTETETPLGSSDSLEIQTPEAPVVEEEFNINIDAPNREGVQLNQDGSVSTHKMRTETFDDENWFSFPTIFQNEDGEFVDMSEQAESDWKSVYAEAKKRGEVADFGTDKDSALAYGEGSWKERYNSKKNKNLLKKDFELLSERVNDPNRAREEDFRFTKRGEIRETQGKLIPLTVDEELKLKIEADPNIQKALAIGYIKQSDINSALKGDTKSIEKLQDISVKSIDDNATKLQEEIGKEYSQYSDIKNFTSTLEEKAERETIVKKVKDFDEETQRLIDLVGENITIEQIQTIIGREEGAYTEEEFEIYEDDYEPTGFEDDLLGSMYDQQALKALSGDENKIDIAGFNGYLIENGFKERYNKLLGDDTISEDGRDYDYSGNYNPTLAAEKLKYDYLKNYLAEVDLQNINKQVLEYELKNNGANPFLNGDIDKINLEPAVSLDELGNYMGEEFKTLALSVTKQKAETKENYQKELSGGAGGDNTQWLLDAGSQGGRSVNDRINSFSEGVYGWVGMEQISDEIRMNQAETELNRDDMLRYTYASGRSAFANGREYMIDDNGEIYDLDLKIRVSGVLEPDQIKEIRKQVQLNGVETSSFSGTGAAVTTAGVASDMLLQIALTRGVGMGGQSIRGIAFASKYKQGRQVVSLLEKIPMKATTASAMVAQGTLMGTSLSSQVRKQALEAGLSNEEADLLASDAATQGYALGVLTAPISTQQVAMDKLFGKKVRDKLVEGTISRYATGVGIEASRSFLRKGLDGIIRVAPTYLTEGGKEFFQENIQQGAQAYIIGSDINEKAGQEIMKETINMDDFYNTSIISFTAGVLMPAAGDLKSTTVRAYNMRGKGGKAVDQMKSLALLASNVKKTKALLDSQVKKGLYTQQQASDLMKDVEIFNQTINGLPSNLSAETSLQVMSDLNKIKELEAEKKSAEVFSPFLDNQIQALKNNIIKNSNFDFVNNKSKQKLMDDAGRELVAEKESSGEKNYTIDNSQIRARAVENFNKLSQEEMQALAFPVETAENAVLEKDKENESKTKKDTDAIQKPSTEKQVLQDDAGSQTEGSDSEVELQQLGEGDVESDTTQENNTEENNETQTDKTSDTTTQRDTEQLTETTSETEVMSVNNDNKVESFANRLVDGESTQEFSDEAQQFYAENQAEIDALVTKKRKDTPKDKSKTRRLATKIANGETNFSNEQIDLYAANEAEVQAEVEAIAKTNSQTVTANTYKGILKSVKSTTRTDKAKQEGENVQRKRFWKAWNKANREGKQDLKTKRKDLNNQIKTYAKGKKGTITAAQTRAVVNKVNEVNLDNEIQVQELIDYTEKVFNNADFVVKEERAIRLNKQVTTRLNKGTYGLNTDLISRLGTILNTPIKNLTSENIDSYNDFLSNILKQKENVKLDDQLIIDSQNMADALYNENIEESDEQVETKETKTLKTIVDKIINEDVDGETLISEDSDFIENNLNKLDSFTLQTLIDKINKAETDENQDIVEAANKFAENRQAVITKIKSRSKGINLKSLDNTTIEAGGVKVFQNIKDSDLIGLTGKQLDLLEVSLENINDGHYTHAANKLGQSINSRAYDMRPMVDKYGTTKNKLAMAKSRGAAALKAYFKANSKTSLELIRSNPLSAVDNAFGNYANNTIRNNSFEPIATKYSEFKNWSGRLTDKLDAVEKIIAPTFKEGTNPSVRRRFEITAYLLALESESNTGNKGVADANAFIDKTIENFNNIRTESNYTQADIDILLDIKAKNSEGGVMTTKKMKQNLSPEVMKAIGIMQEIYASLGDKQAYATTIVRGNKLDLLNNYVHHKVDATNDKTDQQLLTQKSYFNPQTTADSKTSISRTPGAKAIDFDPVATALRALRMTGMDFFLTNEIQTSRKALNQLTQFSEQENAAEDVINATVSLSRAYDESIGKVLASNFSTDVIGGKLFDMAKKVGYYNTLASVPRAVAELGSNLTFGLMAAPVELGIGIGKYGSLSLMQNGLSFAENVGSTTVTKNWGSEILGGSKSEQGGVVRNKKGSKRASNSNVKSTFQYGARFGKKFADGSEFIADNLLSTPDKMISRPLFFGTFARVFKQETGQDMDVDKITENDQAYMSKYADAILAAKRSADAKVTQAATSNDPFSGVLKNQLSDKDGARMILYKSVNSYMARFSINEFVTARQAVAGIVGQGEMGAIKGAATLAGIMTRMSMYVVMYKALASMFNGILGLDDEDDIDYEELGVRQLVGAGVSLITRGTSGNIPMMLPNLGIEKLNEEYGESLGLWSDTDGKGYNPYVHSIIFNPINQQKLEKEGVAASALRVGSGPLSPQVSALLRAGDLTAKMGSSNEKVADRAAKQFYSLRTALEMSQLTGISLPFYKDIRRYLMAENWSDIKASKKKDLKLSDEDIRIIYGQKELDKRKAKQKKSRTQMKNSTEGKRLKRMEDKLKKLGL
tara:strand:+ start:424 stop:7950 length:7527 start_codon:yes stop_codon:yes gene_type:complete